jgi:two-component system chemotaxis response regulator CheY
MKILIVEDDFTSRLLLQELLKEYGSVHIAVNGKEAVEAFANGIKTKEPYHLICMDIMMPEMDGHQALNEIRALEESRGVNSTKGVKIIMTSALDDPKSVVKAFYGLCDGYVTKPIKKEKLLEELKKLELI